ncbi:cell division protein FtsK [Candidatus Kaiserbacteria bacterium CG10_big_fil_rev_8_21_14_0_10_44_10]|uniref:Cell division protein FtsK n=1 Tax=Candidatus Kaiserbacteria bacterium CG10_big_fil_rev_8_21_14_0_10_44_10 TaxID=1974606 RepID=A0A2H0UIC4_9BACT|nr:MAG: cell division protein FtsK [Candidatus Kaiserbacteria bacterium CG10_big_fil_rev_8_21_14_0_10_44_10]
MARRKKQIIPEKRSFFDDLSPHTKQAIGAVVFVVLGVYFTLALLNVSGIAGEYTKRALQYILGSGAYLAPAFCVFYVYALLKPREDERVSISKVVGIGLIFLSLLGALGLYGQQALGGVIGYYLQYPLMLLFGNITAGVVLGATAIVGTFLTFDIGFRRPGWLNKNEELPLDEDLDLPLITGDSDETEEEEETPAEPEEKSSKMKISERLGFTPGENLSISAFEGPYDPPPLSLLSKDRGKSKSGDVKANANIIKRTLKNFNIEVEMDEVSIGPSVTRFAIKPAEGVRISKIVGLQNNLELALAASPIRIEAPIPGKSLVGIEVPNTQKATIGLANLLGCAEYADSPKPLLVALGRDITGIPHFANVAKMPHILIAGTTGSGKSVTIHALVTSLLFRNSPEQLRFIMIDPKRVELTLYNGIPHLLTPVITDSKKAILSLKWAIKEMERRYDILQAERARDVDSYHEKVYKPAKAEFIKKGSREEDREALPEPMPYIVIFIDELADLMSSYPRELEASIVRLAQMSRAVGIHLVLSTQRPSVNVITGLIKANVPSRVALQVASQIDSRTILDQIGAEKLLGAGDMLFLSGELSKPIRLQSAYISEDELHNVVDYLKSQGDGHDLDSIDLDNAGSNGSEAAFGSMGGGDDDDLFDEAKHAVTEAGKASTSYLQRKLRIGYSRAARLMDLLEERGVIGPQDGSKPRDILGASDGGDDSEERF